MAGLWYRAGTVSVTNGSKKVTGFGSQWKTTTYKPDKGHTFWGPDGKAYEIDYVESDTVLYLVMVYAGVTAASQAYSIDITRTSTIPAFSRELSAQLAYAQGQYDSWQQVLTGSGMVTLTAPDGQEVQVPSFSYHAELAAAASRDAGIAEAAATAAMMSAKVYSSSSAGLAATTSGQYFSVLSGNVNQYVNLYLNNSGVAVLQKTYPSDKALDDWQRKYPGLFFVAPYYEDAGNALYFKPTEYQTSGNFIYIRGGYLADAAFSYQKLKDDLLAAGIPPSCAVGVTSPLGVTDCIKLGGISTLWYEPVAKAFTWGLRTPKNYYLKVLEYNASGVAKCEEYPLVVDSKHAINMVKVDSKIPCQVITANNTAPYIPNIDVTAKTLTFYMDTLLEAGWYRHIISSTTVVDLSVVESSALVIYYHKVSAAFVVKAWNYVLSDVERYNYVLVAALRLGTTVANTHMSIACPYTVNGKLVQPERPPEQATANIYTPLEGIIGPNPKFPEYTTETHTFTLYRDTILQVRDLEWVLTSDMSIDVGTASSANRVWWNTATNTLEAGPWGVTQTAQQLLDRVLVATIRQTSPAPAVLSIASPYTVNGKLFGITPMDGSANLLAQPMASIYTPLTGATQVNPKLPEYTAKTRTFTLFSNTILQLRDREWVLPSDMSVVIPTASSANRIWWNTSTDTLETGAWSATQTATQIQERVLVASIRHLADGYAAVSMLCPYTINGKLFGTSQEDGVVHNPLDANIKGIVHRGYSSLAPQNTLPAYKKAGELHNYYVEGDIRWTLDQVPVLLHDETIDATSDGTGLIADITFETARTYDFGSWFSPAYAGTQIPSFEEILKSMKNLGLHGFFELKTVVTTAQINALIALLNKTGMFGRIQFDCFFYSVLQEVITIKPNQNVGFLGTLSSAFIDQCVALKTGQNKVTAAVNYASVTAELVQEAHEKGVDVVVWTLDVASDVIAAADKGVDGIMTNALNIAKTLRDGELL